MQILGNTSNNYQPTSAFTSRNKEIKALDKVCRNVCREFPFYSPTKIHTYNTAYNHPNAYNIFGYLDDVVSDVRGFVKTTVKAKKKRLITALKCTKELKIGNCKELADAGYVACQINGYKSAVPIHMYAFNTKTKEFRDLDHVLVGINFTRELKDKPKRCQLKVFCDDRKAMILDPWEGFADYANNASVRYKAHKTFGKKLRPEDKICYIPVERENLSRKEVLFYRHEYPNLSEKKKFNLLDRIIWAFTKKSQFNAESFPVCVKECYRTNHHLKGALTSAQIQEMYEANK